VRGRSAALGAHTLPAGARRKRAAHTATTLSAAGTQAASGSRTLARRACSISSRHCCPPFVPSQKRFFYLRAGLRERASPRGTCAAAGSRAFPDAECRGKPLHTVGLALWTFVLGRAPRAFKKLGHMPASFALIGKKRHCLTLLYFSQLAELYT